MTTMVYSNTNNTSKGAVNTTSVDTTSISTTSITSPPKTFQYDQAKDNKTFDFKTESYEEKLVPIYCEGSDQTFYCPKFKGHIHRFVCYNMNKGYDDNNSDTDYAYYDAYLCGCNSSQKVNSSTISKLTQCQCQSTMTMSDDEPVELACTVKNTVRKEKDIITIGVIIPYSLGSAPWSSYKAGDHYASAMYIALDDIRRKENLLSNYEVKIVWSNHNCSWQNSVRQMFEMVHIYDVDGFIGGGCQGCLVMARNAGALDKPIISHVSDI